MIAELQRQITPENGVATAIVTANYRKRSADLQRRQYSRHANRDEERRLRIAICEWEKQNIAEMLERDETDENTAQYYLNILDGLKEKYYQNRLVFRRNVMRIFHRYRRTVMRKEHIELRTKVLALMETNTRFVLEKLKGIDKTENSPVVRKITAEYELHLSMFLRGQRHGESDSETVASVLAYGFQVERDNIQAMLECGRISRETAKEMRHNISLLELQLKKDYF